MAEGDGGAIAQECNARLNTKIRTTNHYFLFKPRLNHVFQTGRQFQ